MAPTILRIFKLLTIAVAGAILALLLHVVSWDITPWWFLPLFFGWVAGPMIAAYLLAAARPPPSRWRLWILLLFSISSSAVSVLAYWEAFFLSPPAGRSNSTAALVLLFLPMYQWLALLGAFALSWGGAMFLEDE